MDERLAVGAANHGPAVWLQGGVWQGFSLPGVHTMGCWILVHVGRVGCAGWEAL